MTALDSQLNESALGGKPAPERAVGRWLLICAAMVFVMAVVGAITRLTESGLSIMEWAPLMGALPPFTESEWLRLFALYQETGEYRAQGATMDLPEFKTIFWWEYIHRLWGRLIGLVFGGGFLWFLLRGRLERRLIGPLALLFALGGLQGFLGWYMVASGFSARTDVSQYRLVIHLTLALAIYAALLWTALGLLEPRRTAPTSGPRGALFGFIALLTITLVSGGFVAGLDAGMIYNDFPLMGRTHPAGRLRRRPAMVAQRSGESDRCAAAPPHARHRDPARGLADLVAGARSRRSLRGDCPGRAAPVGLGITTLLLVVPVWLGAMHQAGGILLLSAAIWALHRLTPGRGDA